METWIDLFHAFRRLAAEETFLFVTDNAVGEAEEENLWHLTTNLAGEIDPATIVPFLTCKHSLEYCLLYASRASARGIRAVTVVGGDQSEGHPRCVPHAFELRHTLAERLPTLALGGWTNLHRDQSQQMGFLLDRSFGADYYLTQVVSHHDAARLESWLDLTARGGLALPGVFGVFLYRNARPAMLERLARFFPVPAEALTREFESGATPEEICARTVVALRRMGIDKVYLCNLGGRQAAQRYARIAEAVDRLL
jgi:5,10-methylenetetrahydrofolate reductase